MDSTNTEEGNYPNIALILLAFGLIILVMLFFGFAVIALLLLPFGYNFTDKVFYTWIYGGQALIFGATIYNFWAWWRYRNTPKAPRTALVAALIFLSMSFIISLSRDLFVSYELPSVISSAFIYTSLVLLASMKRELRIILIPIILYFCFLLSLNTLSTFDTQFGIDEQIRWPLIQANSNFTIMTYLALPIMISLYNRKQKPQEKLQHKPRKKETEILSDLLQPPLGK